MDAIIIWLGNNAVASTLFSAVCAFLMLMGLIFVILIIWSLIKK